jgi:hypothetical protein
MLALVFDTAVDSTVLILNELATRGEEAKMGRRKGKKERRKEGKKGSLDEGGRPRHNSPGP